MDPHRTERLAEALREELDEIINYELADPRVADASVTDVLLAPDLRHAEVRLAFSGGPEAAAGALDALGHARRHIRHLLAARLGLRRLPDLRFTSDVSLQSPQRLKSLLHRIRKGRPKEAAGTGGGREPEVRPR